MTYREYQAYWERRWNELGIPAKMDAITVQHRVTIEETQVLRRLSAARKAGRRMAVSPRMADLEEAYKQVQCAAMVQVAGELYHAQGHKDVGLSTKNGGNNWTLRDGRRVATDIFTIKPTDDAGNVLPGNFVLVDCMFSGGSADSRPVWNVLGENTDSSRPWAEPPVPEDVVIEPGPTHRYVGGGNDTGTCDQCGAPRRSPVHEVPEGKVKGHSPWLGEDGKGDCDLCFQPVSADIHQKESEMIPGVKDGVLVDPRRWWLEYMVAGKSPQDYERVIADAQNELTKYGIGIMRDGAQFQDNPRRGTPRGRLYLPTAACPFPAPQPGDSADTVFYGVKRIPEAWALEVQVIGGEGGGVDRWDWQVYRGRMSDYKPVVAGQEPEEPGGEEPTVEYHEFVPMARKPTMCAECGETKDAAVHQKPEEPKPGGGSVDTDRIVAAIEKASREQVAAIDKLRTDVIKSVADFGKLLPGIFGNLGGLFGKKSARKK